MADKVNNLQDIFLNTLRRTKTPVTMFLVKGVKLQGIITWFDNFSVLLRRDGQIAADLQACDLDRDAGSSARPQRRSTQAFAESEEGHAAAGGLPPCRQGARASR